MELEPGAIFDDYCYLGLTEEAGNIEKIFDGYGEVLRKYIPPLSGRKSANRHSVTWGSWNDGIFRAMDQERLFKMADFIKANLPTVEWMQIDDGYALNASKLDMAHGLGAPYEENSGVDLNKFPQGLKVFTDGIKERGIKPAVWIGGTVPRGAPLAKERPGWFIDYSYRISNSGVLDISLLEVRDYMPKVLADFSLPSKGSRLFAVNLRNKNPQVLDANIKINGITFSAGSLSLDLAFGGNIELTLSEKPLRVKFNDTRIKFEAAQQKANWILKTGIPGKGSLQISF